MSNDGRAKLVRTLAEIDQQLAEAEDIAENEPEFRQSALDFIIEFQEAKRRVELQLRGE